VVLNFFCSVAIELKSITPAFNHLVGGGHAFDNLTVFFEFWFNEVVIIKLPGLLFV
jgi:hypothetical protein